MNPNNKAVLNRFTFFISSALIAIANFSGIAQAAELLPPPYETKDRHNVDMIGGNVSITQATVSIGGDMGLGHSVGTYTSNFANYNDEWKARFAPEGFREPYRGRLVAYFIPGPVDRTLMQVSDGGSSAEFYISDDHRTFTPVSDSRYQLIFVSNPTDTTKYHQSIIDFSNSLKPANPSGFTGFVFVKPDGSIAYFPANSINDEDAFMSHIQRANGLVIDVRRSSAGSTGAVTSVTTNTGFQLKYIYQYNSKTQAQQPDLPPAQSGYWSEFMPKYVMAINNAFESCSSTYNIREGGTGQIINNELSSKEQVIEAACPSLTKTWPIATYLWPDYMPVTFYTGTGLFKVIDPEQHVTEYVHTAWATKGPTDNYKYPDSVYATTPRLTQIKKDGKVVMNYSYETRNSTWDIGNFSGGTFINPGRAARLSKSWIGTDEITYTIGVPIGHSGQQTGVSNVAGGYKAINSAEQESFGLSKVESWDKTIVMDGYKSNRLGSIKSKLGGDKISFGYDESIAQDPTGSSVDLPTAKSHNVISQTKNGATTTASGHVKCTLKNYKTCNQALKITDPNNNETDYEYDPLSGQPSKVILPADEAGIRPQTSYTYTAKYAYYKKPGSATVTKAALPVYLLTRESKCQTSAASSNGCTGSDEIVTEYDYGPDDGTANNLLLRGITVTAKNSQGEQESRRTCYSYNEYGYRIGETKPKANLAACY